MKFLSALLLFVGLTFTTQAQKVELQTTLDNFYKANNEANWELMTSYIYPTFFEHQNKAELLDIYSQTLAAGYHNQYYDVKITSIDKTIKANNQTYASIQATGKMLLKITNADITESGMKAMANSLKIAHGDDNVHFNKNENAFEVKMNNIKYYGIEKDNKWYVLNNNSALYIINSKCIPVDVLNKLNGEAERKID